MCLHCILASGVLREFSSINGRSEVNLNLQIALPLGALLLKDFKSIFFISYIIVNILHFIRKLQIFRPYHAENYDFLKHPNFLCERMTSLFSCVFNFDAINNFL